MQLRLTFQRHCNNRTARILYILANRLPTVDHVLDVETRFERDRTPIYLPWDRSTPGNVLSASPLRQRYTSRSLIGVRSTFAPMSDVHEREGSKANLRTNVSAKTVLASSGYLAAVTRSSAESRVTQPPGYGLEGGSTVTPTTSAALPPPPPTSIITTTTAAAVADYHRQR